MKTTLTYITLLLMAVLGAGCALFSGMETNECKPYIEVPVELRSDTSLRSFIESVKTQFRDKRIFIDPGHGGEDRKNKGRNKLVVEADINLHTALALRDFLVAAGAEVVMSRSIDKTVDLVYRSEMANNSCADLFISVHHNAPGSNKDNWTNYTSTYYHALETDYEYEPMERDMARYVQRDLSYAMRNPGGLGSFDGTYSDYIIYPKSGFAVLRRTKIPSILVECSFFSHTNEETRLADKDFNRIAGFGIFRGLSRYLKNSIPKITPLNSECTEKSLTLTFSVQDSVKLLKNTVKVYIDKKTTNDFSFSNGKLILNTPYSYKAPLEVKILVQNERGNFSEPFQQTYFFIKPSKE